MNSCKHPLCVLVSGFDFTDVQTTKCGRSRKMSLQYTSNNEERNFVDWNKQKTEERGSFWHYHICVVYKDEKNRSRCIKCWEKTVWYFETKVCSENRGQGLNEILWRHGWLISVDWRRPLLWIWFEYYEKDCVCYYC